MHPMPCQGPRLPSYPYPHHWPHPDPFGGRIPQQPMFVGQQPHLFRGSNNNPRYNNFHRQNPQNNLHQQPRHYHSHRGPNRHGNNHNDGNVDACFICGDALQNSDERAVHLCCGDVSSVKEEQKPAEKNEIPDVMTEEELDARLETVLLNIKDCLKNKYQRVTDTLEQYVTDRIDEIHNIHHEVSEEKTLLETMKRELEKRACELEAKEKDLKERQKNLSRDKAQHDTQHRKEKAEICRQWQQLKDEIIRMEEMHELQKGRVRLDVGGNVYTTSRLTLTRDTESMLGAMFSGRHEVVTEKDGTVFIDRDGTHFRYILNYLRDGGMSVDALPRNRQILRELKNEAVYYQLHSLIQQIEKLL